MAKEASDKTDKQAKKEKEKKKEKRTEVEGVHKSKKSKKDKQEAKALPSEHVASALIDSLNADKGSSVAVAVNGNETSKAAVPIGALVPFANPLADDKAQKKVLKSVKKAAKNKSLKRGVKEVVKALRKSNTAPTAGGVAPGVVVLAADISPMDVISHIPVLCEDHAVPYIYIRSRAELGVAGSTKRPTSVVMISPERGGKKQADAEPDEEQKEFKDVYQDLLKLVEKESRNVRI